MSPVFPSGCRILVFVKGPDGEVCGLRGNGQMELGGMGASLPFSPVLPFYPLFFPDSLTVRIV